MPLKLSLILITALSVASLSDGCSRQIPQPSRSALRDAQSGPTNNASYYQVFASSDEAMSWAHEFEAETATMLGTAARPLIPRSDPRYAQADQVERQIWDELTKLYPRDTAGVQRPVVVIIQDPTVNAYAVFDRHSGKVPDAFFVFTGALNPNMPADELAGLFAHELTHLVLKHAYPGIEEKVAKYYRVTTNEEPLGFLQKDDPALRSAVLKWAGMASLVGIPLKEMNGVPNNVLGTPVYTGVLTTLTNKYAKANDLNCHAAAASFVTWNNLLATHISHLDYSLNLSDADLAALSNATATYGQSLSACLAAVRDTTLVATVANMYQVSEEAAAQNLFGDGDQAIIASTPNLIDQVLTIGKKKQAEMLSIQSQNDFEHTRVFSIEEQADDSAVRVMAALHRDPTAIANFLADNVLTPDDKERCLSLIESGAVPGYGPLNDPHHSTCYRIYHVKQFAKYINDSGL